jgi:hypothetical protein
MTPFHRTGSLPTRLNLPTADFLTPSEVIPHAAKAPLPCPVPGCPELTTGGRRPKHAKEAEQQRGTTTAKGYGVKWERIRRRYLYGHPWCVLCTKTATVAPC